MTISNDSSAPLVTVIGATGAQGGSVIKALLESDKPYRIRGFSRDSSKPEAQALVKQGVDMVNLTVSVENKDEVLKAFHGATYAFVMTNPSVPGKETEEGKLMVDAAKAANVKLLIWSGLDSFDKISGGKYKRAFGFEDKQAITDYAKSIGIPYVNVQASGFMQNYTDFRCMPRKTPDGSYAIYLPGSPDAPLPVIDTNADYGLFVRKAIEQNVKPGTDLHVYSELLSHKQIAKTLSEVTGKDVKYVELDEQHFTGAMNGAGVPAHFQAMLWDMWSSNAEFGYWGKADLSHDHEGLARKLETWEGFCKKTDWSKVLA